LITLSRPPSSRTAVLEGFSKTRRFARSGALPLHRVVADIGHRDIGQAAALEVMPSWSRVPARRIDGRPMRCRAFLTG
jgi:hypothetical protein